MASPAVPSASLLNKLKVAADAATAFNIACKTALGPLNTPNTTSGAIDNNNDMGPVNTVLMENVLQRWRENSEPLRKYIESRTNYFVPEDVFDFPAEFKSRVDTVNLALVLEMFLPKQVRVKYPMLTDAIPLVDDTSINDQDESIIKQRVSALRVPLSDMKLTYLKLCAGRREKHIQYVVRQLLLDICTTSIVITSHALHRKTFKAQDLVNTFNSSFLRDLSLVPSVFATHASQAKAITIWENASSERIHLLQASVINADKYSWDKLCQIVLSDALRHLVPAICGDGLATTEETGNVSSIPVQPNSINQAVSKNHGAANKADSTRSDSSTRNAPSSKNTAPKPSIASTETINSIISDALKSPYLGVSDMDAGDTTLIAPEPFSNIVDDADGHVMGNDDAAFGMEEGDEDAEGEVVEEQALPPPPRIPKEFRFNAPQHNAVRITMTPSPESSPAPAPNLAKKRGTSKLNRVESAPAKGNAVGTKSMINKLKKTAAAEMERTRTLSTTTTKSKNAPSSAVDVEEIPPAEQVEPTTNDKIPSNAAEPEQTTHVERKRKRKAVKTQPTDNPDFPQVKKRKIDDGTLLPVDLSVSKHPDPPVVDRPSTPSNPSVPFSGRPSGVSPIALIHQSEGAGPSRRHISAGTADLPKRKAANKKLFSESDSGAESSGSQWVQEEEPIVTISTSKTNAASTSVLVQPTPRVDLRTSPGLAEADARAQRSKDHIDRIKAHVAAHKSIEENTEVDKEDDDDNDSVEEWRRRGLKSQQAREAKGSDSSDSETETESEYADPLEKSKAKLSKIKRLAKENSLPIFRREKNADTRTPMNKKSNKRQADQNGKQNPGSESGRDSEVDRSKPTPVRANKYATGGNMTGRIRWTEKEDRTLLFAIEALYYGRKLTTPWKDIEGRHGPNGTETHVLERRNCVQLKDRARNICMGYLRRNEALPEYLGWITIPASQLKAFRNN